MDLGYSPPKVYRIWGIWGSYHNMPKAMFYLLKGDYNGLGCRVWGISSLRSGQAFIHTTPAQAQGGNRAALALELGFRI